MKTTQVEGQTVTIGDWVGFKSDIEQGGQIIDIRRGPCGTELVLKNENGFEGDYIGGTTLTVELARDCWID